MDKPTYQALKDDGAKFRCRECGQLSHASRMYHITTPAGQADGVYHKLCLDEDWYDLAVKLEGEI